MRLLPACTECVQLRNEGKGSSPYPAFLIFHKENEEGGRRMEGAVTALESQLPPLPTHHIQLPDSFR